MLISGPPGSGKTLIVRAMPGSLPKLELSEALDIIGVYSMADMLSTNEPLVRQRPFRAPHHTISYTGLIGSPAAGRVYVRDQGLSELTRISYATRFFHCQIGVL